MAKRSLSDSDCDDLFSDNKDSCLTPADNCGHQTVSRKRRRGIIEKRRRDRINNSLTELRRLVPTAFEKQGSAKLEKAEILQMTVDHLKMLHSKGLDALAYDPHKFAMDYHTIGFRECITETGRYFLRSEGMDQQHPLCQRVMSHLHCALAQRELANKQAAAPSWALNPLAPNPTYSHHHLQHINNTNTGVPQHSSLVETTSSEQYMLPNNNSHLQPMGNDPLHHHIPQTHQPHHHHHNQLNHSMSTSPHDRSSASSTGSYQMSPYANIHPTTSNPNPYVANGKPYRPWGAPELVFSQ